MYLLPVARQLKSPRDSRDSSDLNTDSTTKIFIVGCTETLEDFTGI